MNKQETPAFRKLVQEKYVATFNREPEFHVVKIEDGVSQLE
jgi:galactokinase